MILRSKILFCVSPKQLYELQNGQLTSPISEKEFTLAYDTWS